MGQDMHETPFPFYEEFVIACAYTQNFGLAYIIAPDNFGLASDSVIGFLPFVSLEDIFRCCGWLLPRTFVIAFACIWSGAGSGVLWVWGGDLYNFSSIGDFCGWPQIGDGHNCSRIGYRHDRSRIRDRRASGDIKAGEVFGWLGVVDAEATADGSIWIEVRLH
jgi:hypothetical protein